MAARLNPMSPSKGTGPGLGHTALMERPKCPGHGTACTLRTTGLTPEQEWCGAWYDCQEPGCTCSVLINSKELMDFLDSLEGGA